MVGSRAVGLVALGALIWAGAASVSAQSPYPVVIFEKVVDRDSAVPGILGPWGLESGGMAISAGRIAFLSYTENHQNRGLYLGTPTGIELVAVRETPFPGGMGDFRGLSLFPGGADGPAVAFAGGDDASVPRTEEASFLASGSQLQLVIDSTTTAPGGTQPLIGFVASSLSSRNVGFNATEFATNREAPTSGRTATSSSLPIKTRRSRAAWVPSRHSALRGFRAREPSSWLATATAPFLLTVSTSGTTSICGWSSTDAPRRREGSATSASS